MPMKIEVCAKHEVPLSHVNGVRYCKECKDYVCPTSVKLVTVYTQAELDAAVKAAKIEAYGKAINLIFSTTRPENKIMKLVDELENG